MNNVSLVVENGICDGCCECISACSSNNIYILMDFKSGHPAPFVSDEYCSNCGVCLDSCKKSSLLYLQTAN